MQPSRTIHPTLLVVLTHAVGLGVIALVLLAFWLLAHQPLRTQQEKGAQRVEQLSQRLTGSLEVRREHVELTKKLANLAARVERSRELTPEGAGESEFLAVASNIAKEVGLEIIDYQRGKVRRLEAHSELDLTLTATGSHDSICRFLSKMEAIPRAKQIKKLQIESKDNPESYPLEVAFTLYFGLNRQAQHHAARAL